MNHRLPIKFKGNMHVEQPLNTSHPFYVGWMEESKKGTKKQRKRKETCSKGLINFAPNHLPFINLLLSLDIVFPIWYAMLFYKLFFRISTFIEIGREKKTGINRMQ